MDPLLRDRLYQLLAGREGKKRKTLRSMMDTFRRMDEDGFRWEAFAASEEAAQDEGDRFLLWLRTAPPRARGRRKKPGEEGRGGLGNVRKALQALGRLHRYKSLQWRISQQAPGQKDCYTQDELRRLLRLPYRRSEESRLERAIILAHLALGWRLDEHIPLLDSHINPATKSVFLAHPEKNNPPRHLPLEPEFFAGMDGRPGARNPFAAWLRERPVLAKDPHRVWVYTHPRTGAVLALTGQKFAEILSTAGRKVGVRANCTRGRHTRCAAHLAQGKQLAFVKFFMSGPQGTVNTLTAYIELVDLGMLNHLKRPSWFSRPPPEA